jgi:transposase InsO family protein
MQIIASSYGQRVSAYALRWAHMITQSAKERVRILAFWEKHGLSATKEAFTVKQSTLYDWRKKLADGGGKLEALNVGSTRPKQVRSRVIEWPADIKDEIKRIRGEHPNLGKDKVYKHLAPWCKQQKLRCPSVSTVGRLLADLGGLRMYPEKIRHNGRIVPRAVSPVLRKPKRLVAEYPGHVVSFDTIEKIIVGNRRYVITMTDLFCRFSLAWATTSHASLAAKEFFEVVQILFPVPITTILTDNGSEFKKHFATKLQEEHLTHYHTYPKCPKMNAHAERFNRTIQEEFVNFHVSSLLDPLTFNIKLMRHLQWHNSERPHWGLGLKTPLQFLGENYPGDSRMWWTNTADCLIL